MKKTISIIVPVCNEENNIYLFASRLQQVMNALPYDYYITFIDDGSEDDTLDIVKHQSSIYPNIFFITGLI